MLPDSGWKRSDLLVVLVATCTFFLSVDPLCRDSLAPRSRVAQCHAAPFTRGSVVAYAGEPFGVGRITLTPPRDETARGFDREAFELREMDRRVVYPVFSTGPIIRFVRNLLGRDNYRPGDMVQIWFLFRGADPLRIQLRGFESHEFIVTPEFQPQQHERELQRWWDAYLQHATQRISASDYPPLVETYLTNMLSQRLALPTPRLIHAPRSASSQGALSLLLSPEKLHLELVETLLRASPSCTEQADQPLPPPVTWEPGELPESEEKFDVEPLAEHVPEECFYIRFGSFENFRWLRDMMRRHGGDLARVVTLRAHDNGGNQRLEDQLAVKETALAALLGGQVISDVALIGRDLFLQDGAAVGIVFETRLPLLAQDIQRQRRAAMEALRDVGATETTVELAGQPVSLVATPDNRLRSFYVQDGRYHLITTSRWIAEHFLLAGQGTARLSDNRDFLAIRRLQPPVATDTAWVYLSRPFLEGLFTPQYQTELRRRLVALGEMELQRLATAAGAVEGMASTDVTDLKSARLLPAHFGQRVDEGHVSSSGEVWSDSIRGRRGTFLPIPDVAIEKVSAQEAVHYASTMGELRDRWRRMDPVLVAMRRDKQESDQQETVTLRVRMLPFQRAKFAPMIDILGPPSSVAMRPSSDDILFAEVVVQPEKGVATPEGQHLFLGVKDAPPDRDVSQGALLMALRMFRELPAYVGAWPQPGVLERLPWVRRARTDEQGIARLPSGVWRYPSPNGLTLLSFQREIIKSAATEVQPERDVLPAQLRFHVGNIAESALREWTRDQEYARAWQASLGNSHLLHTISQQFGVPRAEAPAMVKELLNVSLICPLDGKYLLRTNQAGLEYWASSAWERPTHEYLPPLLSWFRGGHGQLTVEGDHVDGEITFLVEERSAVNSEDAPSPTR